MSRDEHDRNANVRIHQLGLEVEPAHSGQPHVEHEAAWNVRTLALQELLGGCKDLDLQLYRVEKPSEGLPGRRVVIDHENDRLFFARGGAGRRPQRGHLAVLYRKRSEPCKKGLATQT